jgi:trehalose-6-phosphate synthase
VVYVSFDHDTIQVSICPMGINPDDFELGPEVRAHMQLLSDTYCSNGRKIIVSIDRLDLCKVSYDVSVCLHRYHDCTIV